MEGEWKFKEPLKGRCINIDWLEVHCYESARKYPCDAEFFRKAGYRVLEREYGTRQYNQMFTLLDNTDHAFLEIRRDPVAANWANSSVGMFDKSSCHIRVVNRYCYHPNIVQLLTEFLHRYEYAISSIYRLDLCLDFEKFDSGDDPKRFLHRFIEGKYSKINQGNVSSHGKDRWSGRDWNSISWGSHSSMVSTKLYNKTQELAESKDKPYIRYAWFCAGLIDDWVACTKKAKDGLYTPVIWRLEFSIRSKAKRWYKIENCNGNKVKHEMKEHTLATYATPLDCLHAFAMLTHHYFHFKIYEEGVRKDRCKDKDLFNWGLNHQPYIIDKLLVDTPKDSIENALIKRLQMFKIAHPQQDLCDACDTIIKAINTFSIRKALPEWATFSELKLLQAVIAERIKQDPKEPIQHTLDKLSPFLEIQDNLF